MPELTIAFFHQILKMFLMLMIGFLAVKSKIMPATCGKGFSQVVVGVVRPCAILYAFQVDFSLERLLGLLLAVLGAVLSHFVLILVTRLLDQRLYHCTVIERASMIYSNSGNLLMPLVAATMGQEWMFYSCAYMSVLQVFVWTHGKSLICEDRSIDFKRALLNLNILAVAAGFILFCLKIRFSGEAGAAIKGIGDMLGAASMLSIGISFATIQKIDVKRVLRVLLVTVHRLILYPLIMLAVFLLLRLDTLLPGAHQIILITTLGAGAPIGVVITQMAQLYDKDPDYASFMAVVTMLCSIFTLPALIWFYEWITKLV